MGVGAASTSGINATDLAHRVAPPNRDEIADEETVAAYILGGAVLVGFIAFLAVGFFWALFVAIGAVLGGSAISHFLNAPGAEARYRAAYAQWERKFICLRCGATFTLEDK